MRLLVAPVLALLLAPAALAQPRGVPSDGFPTWQERMLQVLLNRSRAEPAAEKKACAAATVRAPLAYAYALNRAARFHSANMGQAACFQHNSPCLLHADISSRFAPQGSCDGSTGCACSNTPACNPACTPAECTGPFARVALFGGSAGAEAIVSGSATPRAAHDALMNSIEHCDIVLGNHGTVGTGAVGGYWTANFGAAGPAPGVLVAGGHEVGAGFGQFTSAAAQPVEFRVHYAHAGGGPQAAQLNVGGACTSMTLERGGAGNGTWRATVSLAGVGCRRYHFSFKDASGATVLLPETGSYGVGGSLATCPDWTPAAPPACAAALPPPTNLQVK
jgi:uncharacterized protein YkwD